MIVDNIANKELYTSVHPNIAKGLDFIASNQGKELETGRHVIDGDAVYALVQTYETTPASEKQFEAHREYIDIQFIRNGSEIIYWMNTEELSLHTSYDEEKDFLLLSGNDSVPVILSDGYFAILHPQDAHKPGCDFKETNTVTKIVVKCKIR